jgi:hypothetical protein
VRTEKRQRCSPGRAWQRVDRLQAAQAADVADGLVATQYALFDGVAQTAELRRVAEQHAWILMASPLCLLKTPKAARGLEFRDSPPYCRQHVQTHAFYRRGSWPPIPQSGRSATREPRPPSPTARSSSPAAGSAPAVYDRPLALGLALPLMAALSGHDDVG